MNEYQDIDESQESLPIVERVEEAKPKRIYIGMNHTVTGSADEDMEELDDWFKARVFR